MQDNTRPNTNVADILKFVWPEIMDSRGLKWLTSENWVNTHGKSKVLTHFWRRKVECVDHVLRAQHMMDIALIISYVYSQLFYVKIDLKPYKYGMYEVGIAIFTYLACHSGSEVKNKKSQTAGDSPALNWILPLSQPNQTQWLNMNVRSFII